MSIRKKIVLSVSVLFTMLIALVVGFAIPNIDKSNTGDNIAPSTNNTTKVEKPRTYTYEAGDVVVKQGTDTINYEYDPSVNMNNASTTAYEYVFGNPKNVTTAVYLSSINGEGVNIAYAYSTTPLDTTRTITGETTYTTQTIAVGSDSYKYIYVLVTPINGEIPVDFTANVVWIYGNAKSLTITTNVDVIVDDSTTTTIESNSVDGQVFEEPLPPIAPTGYYFDAWFLDENYSKLATFPVASTTKLYARYHNVEPKSTTYMQYYNGSYTACFSGVRTGEYDDNLTEIVHIFTKDTLVVPTIYNDGVNGEAPVTNLGNCYYSSIGSIILPSTLITTGNGIFENSSVGSIDFNSCVNLQTIGYLFAGDVEIKNLEKCISLTTIDWNALVGCAITSVKLPSSVTTIGENAFNSCRSLTSIDLSECTGLTTINRGAFYNCSNLQQVILPSTITSIGDRAFYNCTSLTSVTIPAGVTSISDSAFYGCVALESVNMMSCTNLTSVGASAFRNCSSLTNITIPKNVTTIGANAFDGCSDLVNVLLPAGLTTLEKAAFKNCSALSNINTNYCVSLAKIGYNAFVGCTNLNSLTFASNATWYYGTESQYNATDGGISFEIVAGTDYSTEFIETYVDKYWYTK